MRLANAVLLAACCALVPPSGAQEPKAAPKADKKDDKAPAKKEKELAPGYKTTKIEGFTFLVADAVLAADVSKYERKPLEVLELECKTLVKILSPRAVDALRKLVVWVEWDETVSVQNGREGVALAVYYGGSAALMEKDGKHPLRAKTVTVHTLKKLTENRQPKADRGESLLLHEFAHAVHDQMLGFDHPGVKGAYQQAMERKLVDKDQYAATNHMEFFAEMSRAYLDRLRYYPHTRADLLKHDPATYKVLEAAWAGAAKKGEPGSAGEAFDLALTLPADVKFGKAAAGTVPTAEDLAGKVVVIGYWGGDSAAVLDRLDRMHDDLSPYGLLAVATCAAKKDEAEIAAEAAKRAQGFPVVDRVYVKDKEDGQYRTQLGGHALVFDHTGACVFRGSAYDADKPAKAAVGRKLLAEACGPGDPPAAFKAVVEAVGGGADPVAVLPKVTPLANSPDEATKAAAKKLADAILAPGQKALADAKAGAKADPVGSFVAAEGVAARYKGTALATKAQELVTTLGQDKAVAAERKARSVLAQFQKAETHLRGQPGSFNPTDAKFAAKHQQTLAQMQTLLDQLRKQHPTARATAEAEKVGREFGLR